MCIKKGPMQCDVLPLEWSFTGHDVIFTKTFEPIQILRWVTQRVAHLNTQHMTLCVCASLFCGCNMSMLFSRRLSFPPRTHELCSWENSLIHRKSSGRHHSSKNLGTMSQIGLTPHWILPSSVQVQYQFSPIWTEISFKYGYYHAPTPTWKVEMQLESHHIWSVYH